MDGLGRALIIAGVVLALLGVIFSLGTRVAWLGHLPGDIVIRKGSFTFYFPLVTSLLISAVLTLVLYLFRR